MIKPIDALSLTLALVFAALTPVTSFAGEIGAESAKAESVLADYWMERAGGTRWSLHHKSGAVPETPVAKPVPVVREAALAGLLHDLLSQTADFNEAVEKMRSMPINAKERIFAESLKREVDASVDAVSAALCSEGPERHVRLVMGEASALHVAVSVENLRGVGSVRMGSYYLDLADGLRRTLAAIKDCYPADWLIPKLKNPAGRKEWETFVAAQRERLARYDEEYSSKEGHEKELRLLLRGLDELSKSWEARN